MSTPDVRIRLSAEGVADVVAAFKKVEAEAASVSKVSTGGFAKLGVALEGIKGTLAALGVAVSVGAFIDLARRGSEAADEIGKLGQRIGASTENTSALALAARTANVGVEQLQTGSVALSRRIAELRAGVPATVTLFKQLGLSAQSFKGKDAAEAFGVFGEAIGNVRTGMDKTTIASEALGKKVGATLIPLFDDLANGGFAEAKRRADELGFTLSDKVVAATQQVNDDFTLLNAQTGALAARFVAGLAPAVDDSFKRIAGELGAGKDAWEIFGKGVGQVLNSLVGGVIIVVDTIVTLLIAAWDALKLTGSVIAAVFTGDLDKIDQGLKQVGKDFTDFRDRMKKLLAESPPDVPGVKPKSKTDADAAELFRERQQKLQAALAREIELTKDALRIKQEALDRDYARGLIGVRDYYSTRLRIATAAIDAEIRILKRLISSSVDVESNRGKVRLLQQDRAALPAKSIDEERKEREQLADAEVGFLKKVLAAEGQNHAAALIDIEEEARARERNALKQGARPAQARALGDELRDQLTARENFNQALKETNDALEQINEKESVFRAQAANGGIGDAEAERRVLELRQRNLPVLNQMFDRMAAFAALTKDPELIHAVERLRGEFERTTKAVDVAGAALSNAGLDARHALADSLTEALAQIGRDVQTLKGFFESIVESFAQAVQQILARALALSFLKAIFGEGFFAGFSGGGGVRGRAEGGYISGPGGPREDAIPAWLSNGEYVIRAASAAAIGLSTLDHMNTTGRLPTMHPQMAADLRSVASTRVHEARDFSRERARRFADGGLVGAAAGLGGGAGGRGSTVGGTVTILLPPGVGAHVSQSEKEKEHVRLTARTRNAMNNTLGRR